MCQSKTRHGTNCKMAFGRKDPNCPRCQELLAGAPARTRFGESPEYAAMKKRNAENERRWNREHDCVKSKCGPVCTWGQW